MHCSCSTLNVLALELYSQPLHKTKIRKPKKFKEKAMKYALFFKFFIYVFKIYFNSSKPSDFLSALTLYSSFLFSSSRNVGFWIEFKFVKYQVLQALQVRVRPLRTLIFAAAVAVVRGGPLQLGLLSLQPVRRLLQTGLLVGNIHLFFRTAERILNNWFSLRFRFILLNLKLLKKVAKMLGLYYWQKNRSVIPFRRFWVWT